MSHYRIVAAGALLALACGCDKLGNLGGAGDKGGDKAQRDSSPGCASDKDCKGDRICSGGRCVEPGAKPATATPASSAAGAPGATTAAAVVPAIPATTVAAGTTPDGAWLPKFTFRRDAGDQGRSLADAQRACAGKGLSLCSESQWTRACTPAIGALESWTLSGSAEGFAVRGGPQGCSGRKLAAAGDVSSARAGACCDRAIAISTANKNDVFLRTTEEQLMRYETALNHRDAGELKKLVADFAKIATKRTTRSDGFWGFYDAYNAGVSDLWIANDHCDVSIQAGKDQWTADCDATAGKQGGIAAFRAQYVWWGALHQLAGLGELSIYQGFPK